jgi:hypothetical protein
MLIRVQRATILHRSKGSDIDDVRYKNILIIVSNIDHSVRVASAHANHITALPVAPFGH